MKKLLIILFISISSQSSELPEEFSDIPLLTKGFDKYAKEMERLDGQIGEIRSMRPEPWSKTIQTLRFQLSRAKTKGEVGLIFKKLFYTYPHLLSHYRLNPEFDLAQTSGKVRLPIKFGPELISRRIRKIAYRITQTELKESAFNDLLLNINDDSAINWYHDSLSFCRYPLKEQCLDKLQNHLEEEILPWSRDNVLNFKIKHGDRKQTLSIPISISKITKTEEKVKSCKEFEYGNFNLVYQGQFVCAYEYSRNKKKILIKFISFNYSKVPPGAPINNLEKEFNLFITEYWAQKSKTLENTIIDLTDTDGDSNPAPWLALFSEKPYTDLYIQYKKVKEFENQDFRESFFDHDPLKETWYKYLQKTNALPHFKEGQYFDPIPIKCAKQSQKCEPYQYPPVVSPFKGKLQVLLSDSCIQACSHLAQLLNYYDDGNVKFYGTPDAGEPMSARLILDFSLVGSTDGKFLVSPYIISKNNEIHPQTIFQMEVSISRICYPSGEPLANKPIKLDKWVQKHFDETQNDYFKNVLKTAINDPIF